MKTGANKKLEYVMYSKTFRELSLLKSQKKPNNQTKENEPHQTHWHLERSYCCLQQLRRKDMQKNEADSGLTWY